MAKFKIESFVKVPEKFYKELRKIHTRLSKETIDENLSFNDVVAVFCFIGINRLRGLDLNQFLRERERLGVK